MLIRVFIFFFIIFTTNLLPTNNKGYFFSRWFKTQEKVWHCRNCNYKHYQEARPEKCYICKGNKFFYYYESFRDYDDDEGL